MNDIEREAIILNSAWGMIDGMVNWAMFTKNNCNRPTNLTFKTHQSSRLFVILLADFLSEVRSFKGDPVPLDLNQVPSSASPSDLTFLFHLRQVCNHPSLGRDAADLSVVVEEFGTWLEAEFIAHGVNLHAINIVADLRVSRIRYIKMCGDIAKHNLPRLAPNARHLRKLIEGAGHSINEQEAFLAVENFFEWFQEDVFIYHSSQIAEFLNNIRWTIYCYLLPEFERSWHIKPDAAPDFPTYGYRGPPDITNPLALAMYWDVMNRVRAKPWIHRFIISDAFKSCF